MRSLGTLSTVPADVGVDGDGFEIDRAGVRASKGRRAIPRIHESNIFSMKCPIIKLFFIKKIT